MGGLTFIMGQWRERCVGLRFDLLTALLACLYYDIPQSRCIAF